MVAKRATLSWKEAEALAQAVLASTNLLRISEAVKVRWKGQGIVEFYEVKNMIGWHAQPMERGQADGSNSCTRAGYSTRGDLNIVATSEAHKSWKTNSSFWWHRHPGPNCAGTASGGLGRPSCGPAAAGGVTLQLAGGWKTPTSALHYATPGHSWIFEERGQQPVPVVDEDNIQTRLGTWSGQHWWAACIRKEVRDSGLGRHHGEVLGDERTKCAGAKRRCVRGESDSEIAKRMARREEDDSEEEYQFGVDDT